MSNNNNNKKVVPQAKQALNQMKLEIANELGMSNYQQMDKGNLTARENGYCCCLPLLITFFLNILFLGSIIWTLIFLILGNLLHFYNIILTIVSS